MKTGFNKWVVGCALAILASPAFGQTVNFTGNIRQVYTSGPQNFAFRVYLAGGMAGCADGFAYMNASDSNYQATVATLLTAYTLNKPVNLIVFPIQIDGQQRCAIADVAVGE